jgi:hypothetical protein
MRPFLEKDCWSTDHPEILILPRQNTGMLSCILMRVSAPLPSNSVSDFSDRT